MKTKVKIQNLQMAGIIFAFAIYSCAVFVSHTSAQFFSGFSETE